MSKDVINPMTGQVDLSYLQYGPRNTDSGVIGDWMHPAAKEARQFDEQLLMDMAEPLARMTGLKEAGINPLTAAAAVAGQTSNAPQPASSVNPLGDIAGAASSVVDAATGGFSNVANALFQLGIRKPTIQKLKNEGAELFERIGLTKAEATIAQASAEYADENALRDIQIKRVTVKQLAQQYKNLKVVHEQILADIDAKIAQAQLAGSQEEYYNQLKLKTQEETRWIKEVNDFWEANHFDRHSNSTDNIIATKIAAGEDPDPFIGAWVDYAKKYASAQESAKAEESWNYRPSSPVEAAWMVVKDASDELNDLVSNCTNGEELITKAKSSKSAEREFEEAYWSYKHDLYDIYRTKKREYKRLKHGNPEAAAAAKHAMDNAWNDYQNCNRETFSSMLVSQLGNPASSPVEE